MDVGRVGVELEVHGPRRVLRLPRELLALDEEAHDQPAESADEGADDAGHELLDRHSGSIIRTASHRSRAYSLALPNQAQAEVRE